MIYNDISRMLYPNLNVIGEREEFRENSRSGLAAVGRVYKQPVSAPRHALIRISKYEAKRRSEVGGNTKRFNTSEVLYNSIEGIRQVQVIFRQNASNRN